jgi:hypothetical protein
VFEETFRQNKFLYKYISQTDETTRAVTFEEELGVQDCTIPELTTYIDASVGVIKSKRNKE